MHVLGFVRKGQLYPMSLRAWMSCLDYINRVIIQGQETEENYMFDGLLSSKSERLKFQILSISFV